MPSPYSEQFYLSVVRPETVALYAEAQKPLDTMYPVWFARTAYDQHAMTQEASWKKHKAELKAALGLPPDPS